MKKVAVVILNWNTIGQLKTFLPGVVKHSESENGFVVVADNGSTDGSADWVRSQYPSIQLIEFDQNYGFTGGYNRALAQVEAEYFVLLNSDVEVSPHWLEPLIVEMDNHPKLAACQPKILSWFDKSSFEYAGASGGYIDYLGFPFCRGRIFRSLELDEGQYDQPARIFWASGASMFVRSDVFREMNGFDDDFFAHMEEIDLCWRMQNAGYEIACVPQSRVYHVGGGTLPNESPGKLYLNFRNNLFLLYKNLPKEKLRPVLFKRMILDGVALVQYLAKAKFSFVIAILKAHGAYYQHKKILKEKRTAIIHSSNHFPGMYQKSIVFDSFVRRIKRFNQLKFNDL
jgi:GT2 family glycosyltransferase